MTLAPGLLQVLWQVVRLSRSGFYGRVLIDMRDGHPNMLETTDARLPGGLPHPPAWFTRVFEQAAPEDRPPNGVA